MNEQRKQEAPLKAASDLAPAAGTKLALAADFGTVYVKINNGQIMRPVRATMQLFEKLGHFYAMSGKWDPATGKSDKKYPITSAGYTHLNKVASISIMTPPQVIVDGHEQPNPYIERNRKTRAIESVIVRKIGIGFSPAGNLVAIDKTLYYNVYTYFIQAIQAKVKRTKWEKDETGKRVDTGEAANPNAAVIGIADERPMREGKPIPGSWVFFPIEEPLGIWANYEDKAIMECLEEHTQRQRFGDRIAQKIVERNILKDHPAIGVGQVFARGGATAEQGQVAFCEVYGYRSDMGYPDLNQVMKQAARGDDRLQVKTEVIRDAPVEEEKAELAEAGDVEPAGGGFEPDPEPPADADPGPPMKLEPEAQEDPRRTAKREPSQFTKDLRKATGEAEQKFRDRNGKS